MAKANSHKQKVVSKHQTTILLRPRRTLVRGFGSLLEQLFYRSQRLPFFAERLLTKISEEGGLPEQDYEKISEELEISVNQYYAIIRKLRGAGLISKIDGKWQISNNFSTHLRQLADLAEGYFKELRQKSLASANLTSSPE